MKEISKNLVELIDKFFSSEKLNASSSEYKNLLGLKQDLTTGINAHTIKASKGETIRGVLAEDMPLYALRVLGNAFLQGIDISNYSTEFQTVIDGLRELNLEKDREVYGDSSVETVAQNHDRISTAFRDCASIISDKGLSAVFTGSLSLYTKAGIESSRKHSDVDFYIEENNIFQFLKGLKEKGLKFEFKDERLCQREGRFDKESGNILFLNGGTGGGHQCQVNLINKNAPHGFTEVGFFLGRNLFAGQGAQPRFVKYYLDRADGLERPIAVGQQMAQNVTTTIDVDLDNGKTAQVQAHSFEFNLKFKMGTPKARTKDVEDALMFTQNASLQQFNSMQSQGKTLDKKYYLQESQTDNYSAVDQNGNIVDTRTTEEKLVDEIFSIAEDIVALKSKLSTASSEEVSTINAQIVSLQNSMKNEYLQIETQSLIVGLNDKMKVYEERFSMAMPLDGVVRDQPLTDENLHEFEQEFEQKQLASEEVFSTLKLNKIESQGACLDTSSIG